MAEQPNTLDTSSNDPLLGCLLLLARHYRNPISKHALLAGLPTHNKPLTPQLFLQAAERCGFNAKIVKRPINKISELVLPVVLLLRRDEACILKAFKSENTADVIFPENPEVTLNKPLDELTSGYSGFAIFVQPLPQETSSSDASDAEPETYGFGSWFWGTLWHYRKNYRNILFASLFINLFALATSLFVMNIYDRVVPTFAEATLWVLTLGVCIIYTFDFILRALRNFVIDVIGKKSDIVMSNRLFNRMMGMQLSAKPLSVGAFTNRLTEFEVIRDFFTSITLTTLIDLPFIVVYLLLIAYIGGSVVLVPIVVIPIVIIIMLSIEVPIRKLTKKTIESNAKKNAVLVESLSSIETIKGLGAEGIMQSRWEVQSNISAKSSQSSRFFATIGTNTTNLAQQLVSAGVVVIGVYEISSGNLTLGGLIACTILASRSIVPLAQIANVLVRFQRAKMSLKNLNTIMQLPQERKNTKQYLYRAHIKGDIRFDNVSFSYPSKQGDHVKVLHNISFKLNAGEHLGLLGHVGSGKTTLQKLIMGFYKPDDGAIYIDGVDLNQIDPVDLRRFISYVPQNNILLAGSIRDNIMIGNPDASDEAFLRASLLASVDKIVEHHPSGYDLQVGERGESLSGGQRQAVVIARALLAEGSLYLMDEPTSVTDVQSEAQLMQRLLPFLQKRGLLLATHRLSLLNLTNRVILLQNGSIFLEGPRDEVIQKISVMAKQQAQQTQQAQGTSTTPTSN